LIALTIGLAIPLALLPVAMDPPAVRFCLMATLAALGFFLRQTFVIGAAGFLIGLFGVMALMAPDFIPTAEQAVRFAVWQWPVWALGIAASVACNLLIAPTDPAVLFLEELTTRLRAVENALGRHLGRSPNESGTARLATTGVARSLKLLKSAEL